MFKAFVWVMAVILLLILIPIIWVLIKVSIWILAVFLTTLIVFGAIAFIIYIMWRILSS